MATHKHKSLPYRPALDGLRGVAVAAVLLYHVKPEWAPGGWLGVDLFFVLSGFLITSLLLHEHDRWGNIDLIGFWLARARRLLPSLVVVLLAVIVASAIWTEPGRKQSVGWDIFSSLFYFANWRFLLGDEQYFSAIALPSPVRHTWSLSIEEQYYIVFPILMIGLAAIARSRVTKAAVLMGLALLSAWWMTHNYVPDTDPSRVYYGTDTRAFELLIGAAAGCLLAGHQFRSGARWAIDRVLAWGAWPALAVFGVASFTLPEKSAFPFQGGLLILSLLAVLPIAASASRVPNSFQFVLSFEPLRRLGLISYALYLWHWPVIVYLNPDLIGVSGTALAAIQVALSIGLAYLTYHYVEKPIRKNGFKSLIPRQPRPSLLIARLAIPLVAVGSFALPQLASTADGAASKSGQDSVQLPQPEYVPAPEIYSAMLVGNSVPASLIEHLDNSQFPDMKFSDAVSFGCDPFKGLPHFDGKTQPPTKECVTFGRDLPRQVREAKPDLVLFFMPQTLVSDFEVDGKVMKYGTPDHDAFVRSSLEQVRKMALSNGAQRFAISTVACHNLPDRGVEPIVKLINDTERVVQVNKVGRAWAKETGTGVVDAYSALCSSGYKAGVNGTLLYGDGLHFTKESGPIYWKWLAPQLQSLSGAKG